MPNLIPHFNIIIFKSNIFNNLIIKQSELQQYGTKSKLRCMLLRHTPEQGHIQQSEACYCEIKNQLFRYGEIESGIIAQD